MKNIYQKTAAVMFVLWLVLATGMICAASSGSIRVYETDTDGNRYELADRVNCPVIKSGEELFFDGDFEALETLTLELYNSDGSLISSTDYNEDTSLGLNQLSEVSCIKAYLRSGDVLLDSFTLTTQDSSRLDAEGVLEVTSTASDLENAANHPQLLVNSVLAAPNYKGLIFEENGTNDIELEIHLSDIAIAGDYRLEIAITDKGKNVVAQSAAPASSKRMYAVFSSGNLLLGDYTVEVKLIDSITDEVCDRDIHVVRKRSGTMGELESYIDSHGRYMKDGKPTFFVGVYGAAYNSASNQINEFGTAGAVDSLLSYWQGTSGVYSPEWYSSLGKAGLGGIANMRVFREASGDRVNFKVYTNADEKARLDLWTKKQRSYEALDMYYVGDEEGPGYNDKLRWHSDIIASHDLSKPVLYIDWRSGSEYGFLRSSVADIVGIDYYPLLEDTSNIGAVGKRLRSFASGVRNRPVFMVIQCANYDAIYGNYSHDGTKILPDRTRLMNMAMQSVCAGATGIMWYSYNALMNDSVYTAGQKQAVTDSINSVSGELKGYTDIILSAEEAPEITATTSDGKSFSDYIVKRYNGKTYIFAVNTANSAKKVSFDFTGVTGAKVMSSSDGALIAVGSGNITLEMDALGYAIIEAEQQSFRSSDCSVHRLALYAGDDVMIYSVDDSGNTDAVFFGKSREISYSFDLAEGATLMKAGTVADFDGKLDTNVTEFAIVAADGSTNEFTVSCSFEPPAVSSQVYSVSDEFVISDVYECTNVSTFLNYLTVEDGWNIRIMRDGTEVTDGVITEDMNPEAVYTNGKRQIYKIDIRDRQEKVTGTSSVLVALEDSIPAYDDFRGCFVIELDSVVTHGYYTGPNGNNALYIAANDGSVKLGLYENAWKGTTATDFAAGDRIQLTLIVRPASGDNAVEYYINGDYIGRCSMTAIKASTWTTWRVNPNTSAAFYMIENYDAYTEARMAESIYADESGNVYVGFAEQNAQKFLLAVYEGSRLESVQIAELTDYMFNSDILKLPDDMTGKSAKGFIWKNEITPLRCRIIK